MTAIQLADRFAIQRTTSAEATNRHVIGSVRLREAARFVFNVAGAFALVSAIVGVRLYIFMPPL